METIKMFLERYRNETTKLFLERYGNRTTKMFMERYENWTTKNFLERYGKWTTKNFLERYGKWTTDKTWLIKHLATGTVTQQHALRQENDKLSYPACVGRSSNIFPFHCLLFRDKLSYPACVGRSSNIFPFHCLFFRDGQPHCRFYHRTFPDYYKVSPQTSKWPRDRASTSCDLPFLETVK